MNKDVYNRVLRDFLGDWLEWANSEDLLSKQCVRYCRYEGLCGSLYMYIRAHGYTDNILYWGCSFELERAFEKDGLNTKYPFGKSEYSIRYKEDTQHKCPKRLKWVSKKLGWRYRLTLICRHLNRTKGEIHAIQRLKRW